MIKNKNQLKKAIKENQDNIIIKRLYNFDKSNKIKEGSEAKIIFAQSNAIKIKYNNYDGEPWIYFDNIEVKDNMMIYYSYIPKSKLQEAQENAKKMDVDLIPLNQEEYKKINNGTNQNYIYKYIIMINEIIEK